MLSRSGRTDDSVLTCAPCSHRRPELPVRKTDLAGRGALSTCRRGVAMCGIVAFTFRSPHVTAPTSQGVLRNDRLRPSVSIFVLLPRAAAAMRRPDHMLTHVESSHTMATGLSSGRILVVDDDPAVRHLISDYFGQQGIQTVSAMGRSAVAPQLAGGDTSAIILDLHLGQDNGLDLLREIRSGSDVPVVILTGRFRDEVDCVVGFELGADHYLTKPFGIRELYARF